MYGINYQRSVYMLVVLICPRIEQTSKHKMGEVTLIIV